MLSNKRIKNPVGGIWCVEYQENASRMWEEVCDDPGMRDRVAQLVGSAGHARVVQSTEQSETKTVTETLRGFSTWTLT